MDLEWTLQEQLLIENATLFQRSTAQPTIQYTVYDSGEEPPSSVGIQVFHKLGKLPAGKRAVVYVRSYATGEMISKELGCLFYKARAKEKGQILQEWANGAGGWIVATGALGTGINIEGIIIVMHIDRPYGLTSFVQQSGRGGRSGEVSESIVVVRVKQTSGWKRKEMMSDYTVEQVDEEAMTEFIQSKGCRRIVLGRRLDGDVKGTDCISTDSVLCDQCMREVRRAVILEAIDDTEAIDNTGIEEAIAEDNKKEAEDQEESGNQAIGRKLQEIESGNESMMWVMDRLQRRCIYCELFYKDEYIREAYKYVDCKGARYKRCDIRVYRQWRKGIDMEQSGNC